MIFNIFIMDKVALEINALKSIEGISGSDISHFF